MNFYYCLFDCETNVYVTSTKSATPDQCVFEGVKWLTEDWGDEEWTSAWNQFKTFEELLRHYNYVVDQLIITKEQV